MEAALKRAERAGLKVTHDKNRHRWGWVICCPCNDAHVVFCTSQNAGTEANKIYSSSKGTVGTRDWYFTLHLQEKLTPEQADTLDGLDRFCDGRISRVESPGRTRFSCLFGAETLTEAITEALGLFEDFPGVLVRSVELDWIALDENGMATPAVVPAPPPVEAESAAL